MIRWTFGGIDMICNKCGRIRRGAVHVISDKFLDKYDKKKIYCGRCIQARLHRSDPEWDFDKEFAYEKPERPQWEIDFIKCMLGKC